ncbi:LLM class F420-dependent oxidoreductase [Actinomadura graeca]|uniref:LLM class F420-dependent oxidoreductase n=1 Tax=Actinomadura graeca TaxID=2750812 RepID=A0ABX8QPU9_9ACTN|nr:LLM class F420-dependent oxidoreductase [Actinomadura graeca]QXJ20643.1 LLM class F420-dependent oxidoreductase [Actinomadura graeca]
MRLRIFTEPQLGADYETQLAVAKAAEELGFDAFIRSDHYLTMLGSAGDPGPTDSWVTLGALARETSRIRLGTLVTAATFRLPGPLAIAVAQVDRMSGGRVEFGLGTGWYEQEHTAYGIPFGSVGERFDRLEEQLRIVTGLWRTPEGGRFSFAGEHYTLADSPALPKPARPGGPPVIIGGTGAKRTPRLAAEFADEYNVPFQTPDDTAAAFGRVRAACRDRGRTRPLAYSVAQTVCCGRDDAEVRRRAETIGQDVADLREGGLAGTPAEIVEKIGAFGELGAECVYLQVLDMRDLDHIALLASDVLAQL